MSGSVLKVRATVLELDPPVETYRMPEKNGRDDQQQGHEDNTSSRAVEPTVFVHSSSEDDLWRRKER